ncbi:hypothetical protein M0G43_09685 [Subsaxibacter sp. CAU 1640]|uniref:hypothetical protein n=1 Tax=Subsaxibacter sp. CAU 1640 TaxID=2933271 RepID=UPI002003EDB2|nr:hypothetical protein [Subsaxibacter sp. CAU 1640]MCK7590844.1 hypothetical protein [Subsaxibacter sp. CAU 1640]
MQLERILKITLITLCLIFLSLQIFSLEFQASGARVSLVLLLTLLYYVRVERKRLFFLLFLLCFSLAELLGFISYFIEIDYDTSPDYFYYLGNGFYILSYIFLIIRVLRDMELKTVIRKFWIHLIVLTVLDVFCVIILSGTTKNLLSVNEFSMEFFYNAVIMVLLTVAMINYMSKNTQKSMNLLLGAIFIFFSEVIQMTYFYISDINILNVMCSLFLVLAFLFFYLQARIPLESEQKTIQQDIQV